MQITEIELLTFRNIRAAAIKPSSGVNLIIGDNAQGKTNLLEAIYLFTGQGSFRAVREHEMIMKGEPHSRLKLKFAGGGRDNEVEIVLGEKRHASLNGLEKESPRGLTGSFLSVVFSPTHLSLIKDGPALRRAFLDEAIAQLKPRYAAVLTQYNRVLSQRAALLRDAVFHADLLDTLDVWDANLIKLGGLIVRTRESYVHLLSPEATAIYDAMTDGGECLALGYARSFDEGEDVESALEKKLRANRAIDLKNGNTSTGPHRDDLDIQIGGLSARSYGSQGQQRSAVLCLKLAEASLMARLSGEQPVVLLDDVLSELDQGRRDYLLGGLKDRQVFITCCDPDAFGSMGAGCVFRVQGGVVTQPG